MTLHLALLLGYSALLVGLGLWIGRRVSGTKDFFVAGRQLGPGLIFSTMLAANIGAGSTVGATGLGYSDGLAAWWWVGSAALGSAGARLLDRPGDQACGGGARPSDGRRLPRVPIRRDGACADRRAPLGGSALHPRRPAVRDGRHPRNRRGRPVVGGVRDRRRGDYDVLHRRRPADVGVGQRRSADRQARGVCDRLAARARSRRRDPCTLPRSSGRAGVLGLLEAGTTRHRCCWRC